MSAAVLLRWKKVSQMLCTIHNLKNLGKGDLPEHKIDKKVTGFLYLFFYIISLGYRLLSRILCTIVSQEIYCFGVFQWLRKFQLGLWKWSEKNYGMPDNKLAVLQLFYTYVTELSYETGGM